MRATFRVLIHAGSLPGSDSKPTAVFVFTFLCDTGSSVRRKRFLRSVVHVDRKYLRR